MIDTNNLEASARLGPACTCLVEITLSTSTTAGSTEIDAKPVKTGEEITGNRETREQRRLSVPLSQSSASAFIRRKIGNTQ